MNNSKNSSKIFYYVLIAFVAILVIFSISNTNSTVEKKYYNEAVEYFEEGKIESWYVVGNTKIVFKLTEAESTITSGQFPAKYDFYIVYNAQEYRTLLDKSSDETYTNYYQTYYGSEQQTGSIWEVIYPILMITLALVFIYIMFKMFSSKSGGAMTFGKSRARSISNIKVKFSDIAGADEEKEELREIVDFLKSPTKFTELGARIPKGVLLVGPPGTGKTLLARAVAGESEVPFLSISGSDFVEMFVGVGASRVRDLFDQAKRNNPCIIFIDEIDAVGRQRGAGLGGSNDEREQTLNQLLVELDGFEANQGIIVLAATNRSDILDPALLRPGRFDRQVYVNPPDVKGREGILKIHAKNKPLDSDIDFGTLARITSGFTGADIENMLNEAAILAARAGRAKILMQDITEGINKVIMGPQKKSTLVTEKDKKITAYHEAGHAILGKKLENTEDVQEVSIIPRGMAAGYTMSRPDSDDKHMSFNKLNDLIADLMGGRIAEELIFKDITTGAQNDIHRATEIARKMVTEWGMSKKLGFMSFGSEGQVFIGRDYQSKNQYSEKLAGQIDEEIREILDANYKRAQKILTENVELLHQMARLLIERETIYKQEVDMLIEGISVEDIVEHMDKQEKTRKVKEEKERKEKEKQNTLRELDMKVRTSEVFLKHGIITEKEHKEIVNIRNEYANKNKVKPVEKKSAITVEKKSKVSTKRKKDKGDK
ncbi:MAG: ATP-dependent zinc metalloprotease FtsH [Clostridia bacterium]|nr:ATP-dependent zinc metalloprotease FtsH [Clostridia bacterium]